MISVVTVCYNSQSTIERTIKSVLYQEDRDCEHILIDGGSQDKTLELINGYRGAYHRRNIPVRIIVRAGSGIYQAMNEGIHLAKGNAIAMLNSDDWYEKDAIAHMNGLIRENPDFDIIMGAIRIHNGSQKIIKYAKNGVFQTSRHFNHPAMFVSPRCYEEVGGYEEGNIHNDYAWFLKARRMGKDVITTKHIITNYYIGGVGSKKSFLETIRRIGPKYEIYRKNGYSRMYLIECIIQELGRYVLIKG